MRDNYKYTNDTLNEQAKASDNARQRAHALLQRASKITVDTNERFRELQDITNTYQTNEYELRKLEEKVTELIREIQEHSQTIHAQSDFYRTCNG